MGAKYLNVDVEVFSRSDLVPLREGLGDDVSVHYCGESEPGNFLLAMELAGSIALDSPGPDRTAKGFCGLIESLTGPAREAWESAYDRVFDIGYDAVLDRACGQPVLSPTTLQQIGSLNARLALSVYTMHLERVEK
jgi:hypothetical protein